MSHQLVMTWVRSFSSIGTVRNSLSVDWLLWGIGPYGTRAFFWL